MSGLLSSLQANSKALSAQALGIALPAATWPTSITPTTPERVVLGPTAATIMTGTGPEGTGVEAMGGHEIRDSLLDQQVLREGLAEGGRSLLPNRACKNAQADSASRIQQRQHDSSAGISDANGISGSLTNFL